MEIGFLLEQGKDSPNPTSHFLISLLLYITLETFAKSGMATNPNPFPMNGVDPQRVPARKPALEKMPYLSGMVETARCVLTLAQPSYFIFSPSQFGFPCCFPLWGRF